jgi:hypothetical protein
MLRSSHRRLTIVQFRVQRPIHGRQFEVSPLFGGCFKAARVDQLLLPTRRPRRGERSFEAEAWP